LVVAEEEESMPEPRRPRISVVNDNPDFLELMSAILDEDAGYDVRLFDGQRTGIDVLADSDPDLVIVDLLLAGASGWEIVSLGRADERLAAVPIIVCSADVAALRERTDELEQVGNVHVLAKPFSIDQITGLVEHLIGRAAPASG
jgi:CheY-like chemotaxis protein